MSILRGAIDTAGWPTREILTAWNKENPCRPRTSHSTGKNQKKNCGGAAGKHSRPGGGLDRRAICRAQTAYVSRCKGQRAFQDAGPVLSPVDCMLNA